MTNLMRMMTMNNPFTRSREMLQGNFIKDSNAALPKATTYDEIANSIKQLHVPNTALPVPSIGNSIGVSKSKNGMNWISFENSHGDWKDSDILSPPDEYLAKKDLERQEIERQKMMDNLSDEQKKLLAMVDSGQFNSLSKLELEKS